jgi:predicted dehydrogenase
MISDDQTMDLSRRKFIYRTGALAAGSLMFPSATMSSCVSHGRAGQVRMGYVGEEEQFRYYRPMFLKLRRARVEPFSLEEAMKSDLHAVFLASKPTIKPVNTILLLEGGKDVITPYPLAGSFSDYNRIQEYMIRYDRKLGMLNPLQFYPAMRTLRDWLAEETPVITGIRVTCHPRQVVPGCSISGFAGAVQPLQRMISFITGQFPVSLFVKAGEKADSLRYVLNYGSFQATIDTDPVQTGWILEVKGERLHALADHTGLLRLNDEVEPRISPSPSTWNRSVVSNMEDFLQAVRTREAPDVNSLDGLAAIILNQAAGRSMGEGTEVDL